MKAVKLSVQDFAIPAPQTGSLLAGGGFTFGMQKGIELHQIVQKKRKAQNSEYVSEKKTSHTFEYQDWKFQVEGRMDGFIQGLVPRIEEIKTTFSLKELREDLSHDPYQHPYGLQLLTYGYFYWLEHKCIPELSFHLISTRDNGSLDMLITLEITRYEEWLNFRLAGIATEALQARERVARRKKLVSKLSFPFPSPRMGQMELIETIESSLSAHKNLLLQAPTGLGKTVGVLYPTLKESLSRGQKVIYITPKNSQQQVAEEALEKIDEGGCKVKSLTLTAKSKICMKDEVLCDPAYCEFAKDYYDKLTKHDVRHLISKKRSLTFRTFRKMAEEFKVCPYELQMEAIEEADCVIGDYNHVFGNKNSVSNTSIFEESGVGKPNLVIDEAHNLPARAMAQFSPSISCQWLDDLGPDIISIKGSAKLIGNCKKLIQNFLGIKRVVEVDPAPFLEINDKIKESMSLNSSADADSLNGLLRLSFIWSEFSELLEFAYQSEKKEFFVGYYPELGGTLKITCCDASELIKPKYESYNRIVAFSATVKPFDFYSSLSGLKGDNLNVAEFFSPYSKTKRKLLVIPQVSTKYSEREKNYSKIAETISKVSSLRKGNYLAFFPSFDFMEKTLPFIRLQDGFKLLKQERNMKRLQVEEILVQLKSLSGPTILCAVQGGMFSEGIDYPGKMVIGAFVIGPPLPHFDFERERMREYYENSYQEGFEFAYSYPAMAKAVQAAGRVIRSETDHGIIILMDSRFLAEDYYKTMPQDWFEQTPRELVSNSILNELKKFWASIP